MSRLDLVIFGATGFTGKHTVFHMVEFAKKYQVNSWGIAGRSQKKLEDVIKEATQKTGADFSNVKLIIADVGDEKSLQDMCAQTKVVVNCCGPYRFYGEPVVKAAIDKKAHYVDVTGEPQFMELMELRYGEAAREAGVFVINACGFDSIPSDLGVVFLQKQFSGTLNSVRSYLNSYTPPEAMAKAEGRGIINYGTWESLIYGIAHSGELAPLRKQLHPAPLPSFKPKLTRVMVHKKDGKGKYYLPFLGADESVVYRSQRYFYDKEKQRPVQYKAYFKAGSLIQTGLTIIAAVFLFVFTKISITRKLLLNYPRLFSFGMVSKQGPTEAVMNSHQFSFVLIGEGWDEGTDIDNAKPNKRVVAKGYYSKCYLCLQYCHIYCPQSQPLKKLTRPGMILTRKNMVSGANPGYGATCAALLCAAVTLLVDRNKMAAPGGVMTPAAAFKNTDIITKLNEHNLKYEIIETAKL